MAESPITEADRASGRYRPAEGGMLCGGRDVPCMPLSVASRGPVFEQGKVAPDGSAATLLENGDAQEFCPGGHHAERKFFRNLRSCRRRMRWP